MVLHVSLVCAAKMSLTAQEKFCSLYCSSSPLSLHDVSVHSLMQYCWKRRSLSPSSGSEYVLPRDWEKLGEESSGQPQWRAEESVQERERVKPDVLST
tara:strand:- start:253 stop:546 length:294 start_codon:yes stop_codon:yes gene_type:complete